MSTQSRLFTIYTLTPTHCGTGQAAGAVDLPIAREKHTDLPIVPATTLKGVARDVFENAEGVDPSEVKALFGPEIGDGSKGDGHHAGSLIFCEAKLVAYPARSLNRPFFFATSPLVLERLARDLRAFGKANLARDIHVPPNPGALVGDKDLDGKPLVIEDLVYEGSAVKHSPQAASLGRLLGGWLPRDEEATAKRLERSLVVLPDLDFQSLVQRAIPVQARIKLTSAKTTSNIKTDDGETETGNLWYEEALPADCLFATFVTERAHRRPDTGEGAKDEKKDHLGVERLWQRREILSSVQIGGNETVGYGRCWWTGVDAEVAR